MIARLGDDQGRDLQAVGRLTQMRKGVLTDRSRFCGDNKRRSFTPHDFRSDVGLMMAG